MEVSGKDLTIHYKKGIIITVSLTDFNIINLINEKEDLNNKIIKIGKNHYEIKNHDKDNDILILTKSVEEEDRLETTAYLFFDKEDLIRSPYFTKNLTGITTDKNILVTGGLFLEDCSLYLDSSSKLHINDGTLKVNRCIYNSQGIPISTNLVQIVTTGSYGRDNYRQDGNKSVVNGTGTLDFNTLWWRQNSASRSDWDLTENSNVTLLNTRLIGTKDAYHHILSKNCIIDGFTVLNSYSIELMVTPVFIRSFQSIACHYGLSFYPPGNTPYVKIYNASLQDPVVHIKRNNRSNIILVDPSINLNTLLVTGSTPIKVMHSTSDKIVDHLGNPMSDILITYLYQKILIQSVNEKQITLSEFSEFVHFSEGDSVYVSDSKKNEHGGEIKKVTSVYKNIVIIDSELEQSYGDNMYIRKKLSQTSDTNGDVPPLEIPYAYMERDSDELKYYKAITKLYSINGENHKQTVFAYKGTDDIIQSSLVDDTSKGTDTVDPGSIERLENKIDQLLEAPISSAGFYSDFVSLHS